MNEVQVFNSPLFGQIRTAGTPDKPLFCLSDVCSALGLTVAKVSQRLEKDVLSKHPLQTNGGNQMFTFVNEDGLYDVILDSRKPEAKTFRKWVTSEVLPSIRKTGSYSAGNLPMTYKEALQQLLAQVEQNEQLQQQNALMLPKARTYDAVMNTPFDEKLKTTSSVAAEIGMSAQALNTMLCACGIIYKASDGEYIMAANYREWGLAKTVCVTVSKEKGIIRTYLKWTTRGRAYIQALNQCHWDKRRAWHLLKDGKEDVVL